MPPHISSHLPLLPYLMADCHVLAPSGPCSALLVATIGIGARGPFLQAGAMVVMLVVSCCWLLVGAWRRDSLGCDCFLRQASGKRLPHKHKLQGSQPGPWQEIAQTLKLRFSGPPVMPLLTTGHFFYNFFVVHLLYLGFVPLDNLLDTWRFLKIQFLPVEVPG